MPNESLPGFAIRYNKNGLPIARLHYTADPERRGEDWRKQQRRKYSSQAAWDREMEIVHEAGGGELIFRQILNEHWNKIIISKPGLIVSPFWRFLGGFDHGRVNPTAALLAAVDGDGVIYFLAEYYQPGLSAHEHLVNLRQLRWKNPPSEYDRITNKVPPSFAELSEVMADPSIFAKTQQQSDGNFKSVADLYIDAGLSNLGPAPNNAEIAGMERILEHWRDLDHRAPSIRIVCPEYYNTEVKRHGLFTDGCPNLVWELRRARREQLSAQQQLTKNASEKVVDRDNHCRDSAKYVVLALPEPASIPLELRLHEIMQKHAESPTNTMLARRKLEGEIMKESEPVYVGMRAKAKAQAWRAQRSGKHYGRI